MCTKLTLFIKLLLYLGEYAFSSFSSLTLLVLSNGLTVIGPQMFLMAQLPTSLTEIIIPSTITSIGVAAFGTCSSLSKVTLTVGLQIIGESMFLMGGLPTALQIIDIPSTVIIIGNEIYRH